MTAGHLAPGVLALAMLAGALTLVWRNRNGSPTWRAYDARQFTRPVSDFHPALAVQLLHEYAGRYAGLGGPDRPQLAVRARSVTIPLDTPAARVAIEAHGQAAQAGRTIPGEVV